MKTPIDSARKRKETPSRWISVEPSLKNLDEGSSLMESAQHASLLQSQLSEQSPFQSFPSIQQKGTDTSAARKVIIVKRKSPFQDHKN